MGKTKRKWIVLDYVDSDALRAEDIPYDASDSIKDKLDAKRGWEEVDTVTLTGSVASVSLTGIDSSSDRWRMVFYNLQVTLAGAEVNIRVEDGGVPITTGIYNWGRDMYTCNNFGSANVDGESGQTSFEIITQQEDDADENAQGVINFFQPTGRAASQGIRFDGVISYHADNGGAGARGADFRGFYDSVNDIDGIQIFSSSVGVNFDEGVFILEKFV